MTLRFESFVAGRYLRSKRKEVFISIITVISVLGVAVSVMVLDMVLSVMTGFEAELQAKLVNTNAHITVRRFGGNIENWEEIKEKVEDMEEVVSVFPYTYNQALLSTQHRSHGVLIRGIADLPEVKAKMGAVFKEGGDLERLFRPESVSIVRPDGQRVDVVLPGIIVGKELAAQFGLSVGDAVSVLSPELTSSPRGLIPRMRRFVVVGIYSSGLVEYESGLAYVSLPAAQKFFGLKDQVSGVEILVEDIYRAGMIAERIQENLSELSLPYQASDWSEPNKALWDAIRLEKRVYFIVLLLLVLVASFSIVSTLVMVVMEKGKDIAILKAIGASNKSILSIFLLEGAIIGALGTVLGTLLGVLGCVALREYGFELDETVFSLEQVPVRMELLNFVVVGAAGFLITSLAGVYPALRASKLKPAEAFRFE